MTTFKRDLSGQSDIGSTKTEFTGAIATMQSVGKQLAALPQVPGKTGSDVTKNVNFRVNKLGGNAGNDFSAFIAEGAINLLTGGMASVGKALVDTGMSMLSESTDKAPVDPTLKAGAKTKNAIKRPFSRLARPTQAPGKMATSLLMNASMKKQRDAAKKAEPKRKALEKQLTEAESLAEVMAFYQKQGVEGISSKVEAGGEKTQGLVHGQQRLANDGQRRKVEQTQVHKPSFAAARGPAVRFGMGM
jgi:hypothetical protein